jgi:hypothetical protein
MIMSNSGDAYPGSVSDTTTSHHSATTRGEIVNPINDSEILVAAGGVGPEEDLYKPISQPYKVIGPEDIIRYRLMYMIFGLLGGLLLFGMGSLVLLALNGAPTDSVVDLLKTALPYAFSLATFGAGFYFGRQNRKGNELNS